MRFARAPERVEASELSRSAPTCIIHRLLLLSISPASVASSSSAKPTVSDWWRTVSLYTEQTGANVSRTLLIAGEYSDHLCSHGKSLTRLCPTNHRNRSEVGALPCRSQERDIPDPHVCAYPFAVLAYMGSGGMVALKPPNGDVGVDGMISVIAHELAELSTNPLVNAWYAGEDPTAPTEIGDLCEGLYGTGGGGGYIGQVMRVYWSSVKQVTPCSFFNDIRLRDVTRQDQSKIVFTTHKK